MSFWCSEIPLKEKRSGLIIIYLSINRKSLSFNKNLRDFFRFRPDNFSDELFRKRLNIEPTKVNKILENMINDKIISFKSL